MEAAYITLALSGMATAITMALIEERKQKRQSARSMKRLRRQCYEAGTEA